METTGNIYGIKKSQTDPKKKIQDDVILLTDINLATLITKIRELKDEPESLDKLKGYKKIIDSRMDQIGSLKKIIVDKINILEKIFGNNDVILQFDVIDAGTFNDIEYEELKNDKNSKISTIKILLNAVDPTKIKTMGKTKKSFKLIMTHPNSTLVTYNISFDLEDIDNDTRVIKCTYYVSR